MSVSRTRIHLVEQGGRGGVFQHTVALARLLADRGLEVRLHTASDPEFDASGRGIEVCKCVDWFRHRSDRVRRFLVAGRYLVRTVPHLAREVSREDIIHMQGTWDPLLATLTLALFSRRRRLVFSPHNTFSRSGSRLHDWLMRRDLRLLDAAIVFSAFDVDVLASIRDRVHLSPLIQIVTDGEGSNVWRTAWDVGDRPVVLFAGQLRHDKRLDRVIEALQAMPSAPLLAVVGEDKGAAHEWKRRAQEASVRTHWSIGFQPLDRFIAAIAAADVVVCPYEQASQSGVLSLASAVGVPTVATTVGGLAEAATDAVPQDDPAALAVAIRRAVERNRPPSHTDSSPLDAAWLAHKHAYGLQLGDGQGR